MERYCEFLKKGLRRGTGCDTISAMNVYGETEMTQKRMICVGILLSAAVLLSACGKKPETPKVPETTESVTAAPPSAPAPAPETGTEDPIDYEALAKLPFAELKESAEADFTVTEDADGVTVTAYVGSDERVRIPDRIGGKPVAAIADGAFRDCTGIKVLWIPDSVTKFGSDILVGATSLYALHTPIPTEEGKRFLGWLFGAKSWELNNTRDLRHVDFLEIGGTATELPDHALFDCNDLVTVSLPETMTEIGNWSFARCASLKRIDLSRVTLVGEGALLGCSALSEVNLSALERIGREALGNCNGLRRLILPFAGESRTENRFLGWLFGARTAETSEGLYPGGLREVILTDGTVSLADYAFYAATMRSVTVGTGATEVGVRAFGNCANLREVTLPAGIAAVREHAFSGCTALAELTLPSGVTELGINTFLGCTALECVTLPETLEILPNGAFLGCRRLKTVDLGGVREVGADAFRGCVALETVRTVGKVSFAEGNDRAAALVGGN